MWLSVEFRMKLYMKFPNMSYIWLWYSEDCTACETLVKWAYFISFEVTYLCQLTYWDFLLTQVEKNHVNNNFNYWHGPLITFWTAPITLSNSHKQIQYKHFEVYKIKHTQGFWILLFSMLKKLSFLIDW